MSRQGVFGYVFELGVGGCGLGLGTLRLGPWGLLAQDESSDKMPHMLWRAAGLAGSSEETPGVITQEENCRGTGQDGEARAVGGLTRFELEFLFHEVRGGRRKREERGQCVHSGKSRL
jgi:hypothetical protein